MLLLPTELRKHYSSASRMHSVDHYASNTSKLKRGSNDQGRKKYISQSLPPALQKRIESQVAKSMAAVLWNSKTAAPINTAIRSELCYLFDWLSDHSRPWEIPIGHGFPATAHSDPPVILVKLHLEHTVMIHATGMLFIYQTRPSNSSQAMTFILTPLSSLPSSSNWQRITSRSVTLQN